MLPFVFTAQCLPLRACSVNILLFFNQFKLLFPSSLYLLFSIIFAVLLLFYFFFPFFLWVLFFYNSCPIYQKKICKLKVYLYKRLNILKEQPTPLSHRTKDPLISVFFFQQEDVQSAFISWSNNSIAETGIYQLRL